MMWGQRNASPQPWAAHPREGRHPYKVRHPTKSVTPQRPSPHKGRHPTKAVTPAKAGVQNIPWNHPQILHFNDQTERCSGQAWDALGATHALSAPSDGAFGGIGMNDCGRGMASPLRPSRWRCRGEAMPRPPSIMPTPSLWGSRMRPGSKKTLVKNFFEKCLKTE